MVTRTYLDVDGVINSLNPLRGDCWPVPAEELRIHKAKGFTLHVPEYMPKLIQALDTCTEIVWCTTWEDDANTWISPIVEIPERRVLHPRPGAGAFHWKETSVLADMAENPCDAAIWIEDFGYALDRRFAKSGVRPVDTTLAPHGFETNGRFVNVLLQSHLDGYRLELPSMEVTR